MLWETPLGMRLRIPIDHLVKPTLDEEDTEKAVNFIKAKIDSAYNLHRSLRFVALLLAYFLFGRVWWLAALISLAACIIGYSMLFLRDYLPFTFLFDLVSLAYCILFRIAWIIPVSVVLIAVFTHEYLVILAYIFVIILSIILRFLFDTAFAKYCVKEYGASFLPLDMKAIRIGYQYNYRNRYPGKQGYQLYKSFCIHAATEIL